MLAGASSELGTLEDRFAAAAREIVRLEPSAFPQLPPQISAWMQDEAYTIPQSYCDSIPHNVVSGNLDEDGPLDWAVLCSRADTSRIAIFWSGSTDSTLLIEPRADADYLQTIDGEGRIGFSRLLTIRTPQSLSQRYAAYDAVMPEWVVHDAVEDYFCEKGSSVFYWRHGRQEQLLGAD
jgi:hypothetical protein